MTTLISGLIAFVSGLIFLISIIISNGPRTAKIGDIFVHANPGISQNPTKKPNPFSSIYEVIETKDGKAHVKGFYIHLDGRVVVMDRWDASYGLGKFDERVSR